MIVPRFAITSVFAIKVLEQCGHWKARGGDEELGFPSGD
jgi:hypothetical protein